MKAVQDNVSFAFRDAFRRMYFAAAQMPSAENMHDAAASQQVAASPTSSVANENTPGDNAGADATQRDPSPAVRDPLPPWRAPIPVQTQQAPAQKRRRALPEPDSSLTGPREDGFYFGNDIHTVSEVYKLKQIFTTYQEDTGLSWCTAGDSEERRAQAKLRERRRCVWESIDRAVAGMEDCNAESIVNELQHIQDTCKAAISRVETWARESKKKGTTILVEAKEYAARAVVPCAGGANHCASGSAVSGGAARCSSFTSTSASTCPSAAYASAAGRAASARMARQREPLTSPLDVPASHPPVLCTYNCREADGLVRCTMCPMQRAYHPACYKRRFPGLVLDGVSMRCVFCANQVGN